ncbi:MAG: MopE-related protein, partial [Myxococcota bacterium]
EVWYDGVDQDCDGNDADQDGDGYAAASAGGDDCDDLDAAIHRGATESWYDGVDQDCDGNDTDRDGDGHAATLAGGDDCDDADAATYAGAAEVWYDGVDQGCDGGEDFDQDGDGELAAVGGGGDCDDTDAAVNTGGAETLDDGVDGDCDGAENAPRFTTLETFGSTGTQGPRVGEMSGYVIVTWLADGMRYGGTPLTSAAGLQFLATADLRAGSAFDSWWEWGSGYTFDDGVDFWADDEHWVWAYGLRYGGTRYLVGDSFAVATEVFGNTVVSRSTSQTYDDVELVEDTDGSLHVVGCDSGGGYLGWLHGDPAELTNARAVGFDRASVLSDTCGVFPPYTALVASFRSARTLGFYTYSDTSGLGSAGTDSPYNAYDVETLLKDGAEVYALAEGTSRTYVEKTVGSTVRGESFGPADARQVDVAMDALGRLYVLIANGGSEAWLYWGEPASSGSGFSGVELDTTLGTVDDVDVHVTTGNDVVIAVRGGDDIVYGVISGY